MLRLNVAAPVRLELELVGVLLEDLDRVGVADAREIVFDDVMKAIDERRVDEFIEEFKLRRAFMFSQPGPTASVPDPETGPLMLKTVVPTDQLPTDDPQLATFAEPESSTGPSLRTSSVQLALDIN